MVELVEAAALAAGGLAASEALGVTDLSSGGNSGGGGSPGLSLGGITLPEISLGGIKTPGVNIGGIDLPDAQAGSRNAALAEALKVINTQTETITDLQAGGGSGTGDITDTGTGLGGFPFGFDGVSTDGFETSGVNVSGFTQLATQLQQAGRGVGQAAGDANSAASTTASVVDTADRFVKNSPIFSSFGTAAAAANLVPFVGQGVSAALLGIGSAGEITADALTGQQTLWLGESPVDVTGGGPVWQGPDPINETAAIRGLSNSLSGPPGKNTFNVPDPGKVAKEAVDAVNNAVSGGGTTTAEKATGSSTPATGTGASGFAASANVELPTATSDGSGGSGSSAPGFTGRGSAAGQIRRQTRKVLEKQRAAAPVGNHATLSQVS